MEDDDHAHIPADQQSNQPLPWSCIICGDSFRTQGVLSDHIIRKHTDVIKQPQQCHLCQKQFIHPYQLKFHLHEEHTEGSLYQCTRCKFRYKVELVFKRHLEIHKEKGKEFTCNVGQCKATYTSRYGLFYHLEAEHDQLNNEGNTQLLNDGNGAVMIDSRMAADGAPALPQLVPPPSVLLPTLSQPSPVICLDQGPVSEQQLNQFVPSFSNSGTSYPKFGSENHTYKFHYDCKICNARFDALDSLESHVAEDHGVYACRICHLNFSTQTSLTEHMNTEHGGNPRYNCEVTECDTSSNCVGELIKHYFLAHPTNVLICWACNALFYSDEQLHQHFEREHPSNECGWRSN